MKKLVNYLESIELHKNCIHFLKLYFSDNNIPDPQFNDLKFIDESDIWESWLSVVRAKELIDLITMIKRGEIERKF